MARRLATEYVKACLQLSEAEILKLTKLFSEHQLSFQIKVLDNGNQELVFYNMNQHEEFVMTFEWKFEQYIVELNGRLKNPKWVKVMNKAISMFKGDAIAHRIYAHYTIVYYYEKGTVIKIVEVKKDQENLIYEYKDTLAKLEQLFNKQIIEEEIRCIQVEVDSLLDERIQACKSDECCQIDRELKRLSHRLFILES